MSEHDYSCGVAFYGTSYADSGMAGMFTVGDRVVAVGATTENEDIVGLHGTVRLLSGQKGKFFGDGAVIVEFDKDFMGGYNPAFEVVSYSARNRGYWVEGNHLVFEESQPIDLSVSFDDLFVRGCSK